MPDLIASALFLHQLSLVFSTKLMSSPTVAKLKVRSQQLTLLRQHPILGFEIASSVGDEFAISRVIDSFHTDDYIHQSGIMFADVLDQLGLGIGRPGNENRASIRDRLSDSLKEGVILRGMTAPDRVRLMVDVLGRMIRVQHEPFHIGRAETEHPCFMVIDPNDCMKVMTVHGMGPLLDPECRSAWIDQAFPSILASLPLGIQMRYRRPALGRSQ